MNVRHWLPGSSRFLPRTLALAFYEAFYGAIIYTVAAEEFMVKEDEMITIRSLLKAAAFECIR
jgi:hypothetical protein